MTPKVAIHWGWILHVDFLPDFDDDLIKDLGGPKHQQIIDIQDKHQGEFAVHVEPWKFFRDEEESAADYPLMAVIPPSVLCDGVTIEVLDQKCDRVEELVFP